MGNETHSEPGKKAPGDKPEGAQSDQVVDEFFTRLQTDMRRPDLSQEAISAAFQAIQKLAIDSDVEEASNTVIGKQAHTGHLCPACNASVAQGSQFCASCGVPLQPAGSEIAAQGNVRPAMQPGQHHYHHHYHHHYIPEGGQPAPSTVPDTRVVAGPVATRDTNRSRPTGATATVSRAEAAVRRMTQDWAQACNTKQLDDLVEFYGTDAMVLRPNLPPIRGTSAIREFFFSSLDAGLGDAEFEALRVELFGDLAYEAGRCKTLVPVAVGKRREERGKYLIIFARQPSGEWKALVDCWSSDLNLGTSSDAATKSGAQNTAIPLARAPRKGF